MSLIPYQSLLDFDKLWNNMRLFAGGEGTGAISPKIEITEQADNYLINAEFPGVASDDIHVTLENGILTLAAEMHAEQEQKEKGKVIYQERQYGSYSRSFNIGKSVQEKDIEASFKDGILSLSIPNVSKDTESAKRIPIKS